MQLSRTLVALLLIGGGAIVFGTTLVHAVITPPQDAETTTAQPVGSATTSARVVPVRLRIPSLGIDASVQQVGQGKGGAMAVPTNFSDVGWYRYGPAPGAPGSALIDGHVDDGLGLAGVFKKLSRIRVGDIITVSDAQENSVRFVVSDITLYPYTAVPMREIFHTSGTSTLVLITCDGSWVPDGNTYDHRLVVTAVRL
jgi:sortase (surface protein transpeptidase)